MYTFTANTSLSWWKFPHVKKVYKNANFGSIFHILKYFTAKLCNFLPTIMLCFLSFYNRFSLMPELPIQVMELGFRKNLIGQFYQQNNIL